MRPESQQKYKAAKDNPSSQLEIIAEELSDQIAAIKKKNQVLGYMRIADRRVIDYIHSYIKNSLPEDRVENEAGSKKKTVCSYLPWSAQTGKKGTLPAHGLTAIFR